MDFAPDLGEGTLHPVQRLYSMFPTGAPGLALLVLRLSVAIELLITGHMQYQAYPAWILGAIVALCLALAAGCLTPIFAFSALVFHLVAWAHFVGDGRFFHGISILDSLALVLIGPGAYSFDARQFGRRVLLVLPPE